MKRQALALLLLSCIIAPFCGNYVYLRYEKNQVRKSVKSRFMQELRADELTLFKLSSNDYQELDWEDSKEFKFKGEMYDVVRQTAMTDSVYLWCWHDSDETYLAKALDKLLAGLSSKDAGDDPKTTLIHDYYKSLYYHDSFSVITTGYYTQVSHSYSYLCFFKSPSLAPPEPPPTRIAYI